MIIKRLLRSATASMTIAIIGFANYAQADSASGALCDPKSSSSTALSKSDGRFANNSTSTMAVVCPLNYYANSGAGNTTISSGISVVVQPNGNTAATLRCQHLSYTAAGVAQIGAWANASGTAIQTLYLTPASVTGQSFAVQCEMPGKFNNVVAKVFSFGSNSIAQ